MSDGADAPGGDEGYRPPLPPEDRLWRHPSEFTATPAPGASAARARGRGRSLFGLVGLVAVGAVTVAAAVLVVGRSLELEEPPTDAAARLAASTSVPEAALIAQSDLLGLAGRDAEGGVLVVECEADGPARAAGIRTGDLLVAVAGVTILSMDEVPRLLEDLDGDDAVEVRLRRDDTEVALAVRLEPGG